MSACSLLRYFHLAYFAKPAADRPLYRGLRRWRSRSIVEVGMSQPQRTRRLIEVALRYGGTDPLRYTGIDLFDARPASAPPLTIKQAHQLLHVPGVRVQLAPGEPFSALQRIANTLVGTDLMIIGADVDAANLDRAWFFVPRMLHDGSRVFREQSADEAVVLRPVPLEEIRKLAALQQKQMRSAA